MRNLKILVIGAGLLAMSTVETLASKALEHEDIDITIAVHESEFENPSVEVFQINDYHLAEADGLQVSYMHVGERISYFEALIDEGWEVPSWELLAESLELKVAIYSVPLREENKVVLVKDPKNFVERAIRHQMEYLAIKPMEKGEFWETVPVFSVEKSLSFNPKSTTEIVPEDSDMLRLIPVKDFIRYN